MGVERNLRLLPAFEAGRFLLFWLPVFFLYFSSRLPVERVLLLESAYYLGTVVFEVPSGWFSDRVGRRLTLLIAMAAQTAGCLLFVGFSTFVPFLVGQLCLSASSAFVSGTNHALLYDSLKAVGREREVGQHAQAMVSRGYLALAVSSLVGGLCAGFDLRIAYGLCALTSAGAFALAWRMVEPAHEPADRRAPSLASLGRSLRRPTLLWVFLFSVAMTVFNHVPYEFFQPYVGFLFAELGRGSYAPVPAITGGVFFVMMLLSSLSARRSIALGRRFGHAPALLFCMVLQGAIILAMMRFLHPAVLALVALRSVPMGLSYPLMSELIQPRIETNVRATYLSVQSLAGNLAFSATLLVGSYAVGGREWDAELMARVLRVYALAWVAVLAGLSLTRGAVASRAGR